MATTTKRWLWACTLFALLAAPALLVLIPATFRSSAQEAKSWVLNRSDASVQAVSSRIQDFPVAYRREIMKRLTPEQRANVWRSHIQQYLDATPGVKPEAAAALKGISAFFTPELFKSRPTPEQLATLTALSNEVRTHLDADTANMLLTNLGPKDVRLQASLPHFIDFVRRNFVVQAAAGDCSCASDSDYCDYGERCTTGKGCNVDDSWPACGSGWFYDCNGVCCFTHPGGGCTQVE